MTRFFDLVESLPEFVAEYLNFFGNYSVVGLLVFVSETSRIVIMLLEEHIDRVYNCHGLLYLSLHFEALSVGVTESGFAMQRPPVPPGWPPRPTRCQHLCLERRL